MAKVFVPEFVELELYNETRKLSNNEYVSVRVTQHHENIFMIKLAYWDAQKCKYDEPDKKFVKLIYEPNIYPSGREKVIRLAIKLIDEFQPPQKRDKRNECLCITCIHNKEWGCELNNPCNGCDDSQQCFGCYCYKEKFKCPSRTCDHKDENDYCTLDKPCFEE